MFSGIIETTGTISAIEPINEGVRLILTSQIPLAEVGLGESICVNGTCLTVTVIGDATLSFDVSAESLRRTNLGDLTPGSLVNLERSLRVSDRLSGHVVSGHVDGVGAVKSIQPEGDSFLYTFTVPPELGRYLIEKGSVAVDGISLTVFHCRPTEFTCAIIPHTHHVTTLHARKPGDKVNIENDMQGKYIEKFMQEALAGPLQALRDEVAELRLRIQK
ncbi:MAG: riboflavin synthase [Deltaproteobacteria bacterium]|nr:riboflavin synthase [Deltaproteobacteria bacterium]